MIEKQIYILAPKVDIINVTTSNEQAGALEINWTITEKNHYSKEILLNRTITGEENWLTVTSLDPDQTSFTDTDVDIVQHSYEYKIESNLDCENKIGSAFHRSILLETEQYDSLANVSWNNYFDWPQGVDHYEVWISIDSAEYQLFETTSDLQLTFTDEDKGFDHCFMIKAIENGGLTSTSISNSSCVQFIPEIHTYNIITPNTDRFNEHFTVDNIEHYPNSKLTILNRYGNVIYDAIGYKNNWNGKVNGKTAPSGTYYYELQLNEPRNEIKFVKGYFSILY